MLGCNTIDFLSFAGAIFQLSGIGVSERPDNNLEPREKRHNRS